MNGSPLVKTFEIPLLGKSAFSTSVEKRDALIKSYRKIYRREIQVPDAKDSSMILKLKTQKFI